MRINSSHPALVAALHFSATLAAVTKGFNYGSQGMTQASFTKAFTKAASLPGAPGFDNARLYTMIEDGTVNTPISAIAAAIATDTKLLLGIWCSAGQAAFNNEITAFKSAITQYGKAFTSRITAISVGSEDLYRITPTALQDPQALPGAQPDQIVKYIKAVRAAIQGTDAANVPVGHVDTWTAYVNSSNQEVIDNCDFIGVDAYPYYQSAMNNSIDNAKQLFFEALGYTQKAAGSKPVWVTETGWPYSGKKSGLAVCDVENQKQYWDDVGCSIFGQMNVWYYDLYSPLFGILGDSVDNAPQFNLTCPKANQASGNVRANAATSSKVRTSYVPSATNPAGKSASSPTSKTKAPNPLPTHGLSAPSSVSPKTYPTATVQPAPVTNTVVYAFASQTCGDNGHGTITCATTTVSQTYLQIPHTPSSTATATAKPCGTALTKKFEFAHLIVPIDRTHPSTPQGNSYNGRISTNVSSVFNFDVPPSIKDKMCSIVFLLPGSKTFDMSGAGGISVTQVPPATNGTTYNDVTAATGESGAATVVGSVAKVEKGGAYVVGSQGCKELAGKTAGFLVGLTESGKKGGLSLDWFQDSGEPAIGLYLNVC